MLLQILSYQNLVVTKLICYHFRLYIIKKTVIQAFIFLQEAHSKCEKLHNVVEEAEGRTKELEQHYKVKLDEANRQLTKRNEDKVKFQCFYFCLKI